VTARGAFRQTDIERILKAARKADVHVRATIKPSGEIEVLTESAAGEQGPSPLRKKVFGR